MSDVPARTNEFQQLVALIEKSLVPKAKVTESAMVPVDGMTTLREVDILIEGQFGPYKMKVAVETKDEGRKLSVTTVEQLISKYTGRCSVAVDKLVIVSSRGFSQGASEKAAAANVELLTIEQAKKKQWRTVGPQKMQFRVAPHIHQIAVSPRPSFADPAFAYRNGRLICCAGHDHGTPLQYAKCSFFHRWLPGYQTLFREIEKEIKEKRNGRGALRFAFPVHDWKLRFGGIDHTFNEFTFDVRIICEEGPAAYNTYERRSNQSGTKVFHHFKGTAGGAQLEIVIPQGEPVRKVRPKGAAMTPPTQLEMAEAIKSIFQGMTVKVSKARQPAGTMRKPKPVKRKARKGK